MSDIYISKLFLNRTRQQCITCKLINNERVKNFKDFPDKWQKKKKKYQLKLKFEKRRGKGKKKKKAKVNFYFFIN